MNQSPVTDMHTHGDFYKMTLHDDKTLAARRKAMGIDKNKPASLALIHRKMDVAGIDRAVVLPVDLPADKGFVSITNKEVAEIEAASDRLIGFASVDPNRKDAKEVLEQAFTDCKLKGLKLHPVRQAFNPEEERFSWIYQLCEKENKPIVFHCGLSYGGSGLMTQGHPLRLEPILARHPNLRISIAHCAWPYVKETAALLLKYPNAYTDTACLYFDSANEFFQHVFCREMEITWVDRSLRHQIMFGSNYPRFEQLRMKRALEHLPLRSSTLDRLFKENAATFLGGDQ